jgi:hypothetical protein
MNRNGFTLIEGIVAGAIASVIALSAFTLFQMTTQQSRAGMVHSMLNIKYENAVEQICASIRRSNSVLQTGEVWPPAAGLVEVNEIPAMMPAVIRSRTPGFSRSGFLPAGSGVGKIIRLATHRLPYLQRLRLRAISGFRRTVRLSP